MSGAMLPILHIQTWREQGIYIHKTNLFAVTAYDFRIHELL
jgi:hypothetical protein